MVKYTRKQTIYTPGITGFLRVAPNVKYRTTIFLLLVQDHSKDDGDSRFIVVGFSIAPDPRSDDFDHPETQENGDADTGEG